MSNPLSGPKSHRCGVRRSLFWDDRSGSFHPMGAYLLLALAIAAEVSATVSLQLSEGFSKLGPSIIVVAGFAIAYVLLARVLKLGLAAGVVYAIWAAAGVALVAIIGVVFLKEPLNAAMIGGLALVLGGVVLIVLGCVSVCFCWSLVVWRGVSCGARC